MADMADKQVRLPNSGVVSAFIHTQHFIVVGLDDGQIHILSSNGDSLHVFKLTGSGPARALSVSGSCLVVGCIGGTIELWDLSSGEQQKMLRGHRDTVSCIFFSRSDRNAIVSGSRDGMVKIWNRKDWTCKHEIAAHDLPISDMSVSDHLIVTASQDHTCKIWSLDTGDLVHTLVGHREKVYRVAMQNITVVSGDATGEVRVWDCDSGECKAVLRGHTSLVSHIRIESGLIVTAGADGQIRAWSLEDYEQKWVVQQAHPHAVNSIDIWDGWLVSSGSDDEVKLWRLGDGSAIRSIGQSSQAVYNVGLIEGQQKLVHVFWDEGVVLEILEI